MSIYSIYIEQLKSINFNKHQSIRLAAVIALAIAIPAFPAQAGFQVGKNGSGAHIVKKFVTKPKYDTKPIVLPADTGFNENQVVRIVNLHVIRTCDSDGTWCSGATEETVHKTLDAANAAHYRSHSEIRFALSNTTDLQDTLNWDMMNNNNCKLRSDYSIVQKLVSDPPTNIVAKGGGSVLQGGSVNNDGFVLSSNNSVVQGVINGKVVDVVANGKGIFVTEGDLNGDGVEGDNNDALTLCIAWSPEPMKLKTDFADSIQNDYGAVAVFSQYGHGGVRWDDVNKLWLANKRSVTPNSSTTDNQITLWGNMSDHASFIHESGHYLTLTHTHRGKGGYSKEDVAKIIKSFVEDEKNHVIPMEKEFILNETFDRDRQKIKVDPLNPKITDYLVNYPIEDTPPDAGTRVFSEEYGKGGECQIENDTVEVEVTFPSYGGPYTYTFAPNRRNAMSYFKGCFPGYLRFTEHQVKRMHAATFHHRAAVTTSRMIPTWRNDTTRFIPPATKGKPLKWGRSYIKVDRNEQAGEITVGVDIGHPRGGLTIDLVSPVGKVFHLQKPSDNQNKITGDIRTLFFLDTAKLEGAMFVKGIWKLRIAEQNSLSQEKGGSINDWQLQFDNYD
jgi:Proprotein convertase P-domain